MSHTELNDYLERVRYQLQYSVVDWSGILGMTPRHYRELMDAGLTINDRSIESLGEALDIDPAAIRARSLDLVALEAHHRGNVDLIPERYAKAAFSKRRTSQYIFEYIERHYGWRKKLELLRRLQVTESAIEKKDGWINIHFLEDVCSEMVRMTGKTDIMTLVGRHSSIANRHGALGQIYRTLPGPKALFEATFPELAEKYYDKNTRYRLLKLSSSECLLEAMTNPEVCEGLKTKTVGSSGVCDQKIGVLSSFTWYLDLPHANVEHTSCVHRGDDRCLFLVSFLSAAETYKSVRRHS